MQPEFDVIVVGAGPAGSAAALALARKGVNVLMLEKAKVPGERNMSGGVLYGDFEGSFGMINLLPDFEETAPLQRRITSHEVVVLGEPEIEQMKKQIVAVPAPLPLPGAAEAAPAE